MEQYLFMIQDTVLMVHTLSVQWSLGPGLVVIKAENNNVPLSTLLGTNNANILFQQSAGTPMTLEFL